MTTHSSTGCHRIAHGGRFFAEHGYLRVPSLVQWMATLRCDLSCPHCLTSGSGSDTPDMPLPQAENLIDQVAEMGVHEFLLTGGEPLLRPDLPEVVAHLQQRGVRYSINTAKMPGEEVRKAIEGYPPVFAAVSLDGPRTVHDEFRGKAGSFEEALDAIRFFGSLPGTSVCAGTTVTSHNYPHLSETFGVVARSGADRWGIHMLVPEGKAALRADLFLSKRQLRRLVGFVARKRRYFDVEMADEIGYLGYLEPLVRDLPLSCGAGRSQCVVLPDGEVVPCTTLDRSTSAGNLRERPLGRIWEEGFSELRHWKPGGECEGCVYSPACRAGCWLQRKSGTQCFKEVWHVPGALKTAAGIAVCLGGLSGTAVKRSPGTAGGWKAEEKIAVGKQARGMATDSAIDPTALDRAILRYYVEQAAGSAPVSMITDSAPTSGDPGWSFFCSFRENGLPEDLSGRCALARDALQTEERSLSLAALVYRAVAEPLFDRAEDGEWSQSERRAVRRTMEEIGRTARRWRTEIFREKLDPYLREGRSTSPPMFLYSKAGPRPGDAEWYGLSRDLNAERWGVGESPDTGEAARAYVEDNAPAELMDVRFRVEESVSLLMYTAEGVEMILLQEGGIGYAVGLFDVIEPVEDMELLLDIECTLASDAPNVYLDPMPEAEQVGEDSLKATVRVSLEGGRQYSYPELLSQVHRQNGMELSQLARRWLGGGTGRSRRDKAMVIAGIYRNEALLWPAVRSVALGEDLPSGRRAAENEESFYVNDEEMRRRAVMRNIDFWMF